MLNADQRSKDRTAYLTNKKDVISFSFRDKTIRFKGPYSLKQIMQVQEWSNGYLVVKASYSHMENPIEDYIDLIPILNDLYIDAESFLKPIENVEVRYAG